jgi:hypothetical protein
MVQCRHSKIKNLAIRSSVYVKTYHGTGYALSIGPLDKYKDAFVLGRNELKTFADDAESITIVAKSLENPDVKGNLTLSRKSTTSIASWTSEKSDLVTKDGRNQNDLAIGSPSAHDDFP